MHFGLVLLISFAVFNLGQIVDQTFRWTNHAHGFMNGVFHVMIYGIAWCIYLIPWSLVILGLYRWRKWKRFRTAWLLGPALLACALPLAGLVVDPPTAKGTFEKMIVRPMPESVSNLKAFRSGGGIADYTYLLYFEIDPKDFDKVLKSRPFELSDGRLNDVSMFRTSVGTNSVRAAFDYFLGDDASTWPSPHDWGEVEVYEYNTENHHWWYHVVTDKEHRRVYFDAGCI